jgi:hypothetical protein
MARRVARPVPVGGVRWGKRNRTAVRSVGYVQIGRRRIPLKRVPAFFPLLVDSTMVATAVQLRVIAEESRELLIDRIFAQTPQLPRGRPRRPPNLTAPRPPRIRRPMVQTRRGPFQPALEELTEPYASRKAREGLDGRILLAIGDYVDGIEVFRGEQKEGGVYYMVRPAVRKHDPDDRNYPQLSKLARWLEAGTSKMKARPHWRPTLQEVKDMLNDRGIRRDVRAAGLRRAIQEMR